MTTKPTPDYSSRDYDSLLTSMLDQAVTLLPEWTSRSSADMGVVLLELFAYLGDNLHYYIDLVAKESFLPTAVLRSSVLAHASLLGYRAQGPAPAKLTLQFSADAGIITIVPQGTRVSTVGTTDVPAIMFETNDAVVFAGGGSPQTQTVAATQGLTVLNEVLGTSTGQGRQIFRLSQSPVLDNTIEMAVQETSDRPAQLWTFVDNLIEAGARDTVFTTDVDADGNTYVIFGNNIAGKAPVRGAAMSCTYRVGGGTIGNVATSTVTVIVDALTGVNGVTNTTVGTGGGDAESNDSIKRNAPVAFKSANRGVTTDDYAGLALRVPGIAKAKAVANVYTNILVYVAAAGGGVNIPASLLRSVTDFITPRAMIGATVRAAAAAYEGIDVTVALVVDDSFVRENVRIAVGTAINAVLSFDNVDFGTVISVSEVYAAAMSVDGVISASITTLAVASGSGVTDVTPGSWQIPTAGTIIVTATGGIVTSTTYADIFGVLPLAPAAAGAPTISLARCDTTTTHLEMTWVAGARATNFYVDVFYKDGGGNTLSTTLVGPFTTAAATMDIGKDTVATSLVVRIRSFNGTTGPIYGPTTSVANPCHV